MIAILLVMLGGGIGAVLRALVTDICNRKFITGVLGGLTTFSTLSNELVHFLTPKFKLGHFIGYSLLQFLIGFIACYLGFHI